MLPHQIAIAPLIWPLQLLSSTPGLPSLQWPKGWHLAQLSSTSGPVLTGQCTCHFLQLYCHPPLKKKKKKKLRKKKLKNWKKKKPEKTTPKRWGKEPGYMDLLQQMTGKPNIKRLLLIKENQITQVKGFSAFWVYLVPGESHGRRSLVGCSPWGC